MRLRLGFRWSSVDRGLYNKGGRGWTKRRQELGPCDFGEHLTG
jgi:hypothetical protein